MDAERLKEIRQAAGWVLADVEGQQTETARVLAALIVMELLVEVERQREEIKRFNRSIVAHHHLATLSEEAIRESIGGSCQICARAQEGI